MSKNCPELLRDKIKTKNLIPQSPSPIPHHAKSGGGKGIRTPDLQLAKLPLYQLSYAPIKFGISHVDAVTQYKMVGVTGIEPVTLRLSSACSNQLSYTPMTANLAAIPILIGRMYWVQLSAAFVSKIGLCDTDQSELCPTLSIYSEE